MNLKYYNGDQFFLSRYQLSLTLTRKITLPYKMVVYLLYVDFFFLTTYHKLKVNKQKQPY